MKSNCNQKLLIVLLLVVFGCSTEEKLVKKESYTIEPVSQLLSNGAHSVVRNYETKVELVNVGLAYTTVKKAVTIFEKENKDVATVILGYSPLISIDYMKAKIIDRSGNVVQSFSESDAADFSAFDGFSFFSDSRVKVLDLDYGSFPYTIEVEYKLKHNGTLFLPSWFPQAAGQSVEKASLTVIDKTKGSLRYHSENLKDPPEVEENVNENIYTWNVNFLLPKEREPYGPPVRDILPHVLLAPSQFEIESTKGNASTWKDFGKWYYDLGKGTRSLNDQMIQEIEEQVKGIESEEELVKTLYRYMQDKTRYVSIQLGIGGWKPFPADYVFSNEYGDCKALTNYMHAMLEHFGIKANAVLIRRGVFEPVVNKDFPSNQFNHVLLRVELKSGKVLWLECTSKYFSPGHIGSGNEGKNALLVSEDGGEMIRTPQSSEDQNKIIASTRVTLNPDGSAEIKSERRNTGIMRENLLYTLRPVSEMARIEWLEEQVSKSGYKVSEADFSDIFASADTITYSFSSEAQRFASTSQTRLFVPLNTANSWSFNPEEIERRNQDIWFAYPLSESEKYTFVIPADFRIEALPEKIEISESFGKYRISYEVAESGDLEMTRFFSISDKRISAEKYQDFKDFFDLVSEADNRQMVLVKK